MKKEDETYHKTSWERANDKVMCYVFSTISGFEYKYTVNRTPNNCAPVRLYHMVFQHHRTHQHKNNEK